MLDSDEEDLLQPEMHQTSLRSAERISLFPGANSQMKERANHTVMNPAQYCMNFDIEQTLN